MTIVAATIRPATITDEDDGDTLSCLHRKAEG